MLTEIERLDVVMTATLRPSLIELTLSSFFKNLLSEVESVRLIVNIDRIGDRGCSEDEILSICRKYCSRLTHRISDTPSFSKAVQWGWQQVETDWFLHLEDDWLLKRKSSLQAAIALLNEDREVASIRFNRNRNPEGGFPVPSSGFSLNPSIVRKKFIDEALAYFSPESDPEKQFSYAEGEKRNALAHWKFICYGQPGEAEVVIDTGRLWRKFNNLGKWSADDGKITWVPRRLTRFRLAHYIRYKASLSYWRFLASV